MAVTLRQLCENSNYLYGMRLLAGTGGMQNIVTWIHTLEDVEVSEFLHGGELIFSTGIANRGTGWLLPFVKNLRKSGASGLVINLGPYISRVPDELISYCGEHDFPLFDLPWKTRLVDITRDFCDCIIKNDKIEKDIGSIFKTLIYNPSELEKQLPALESHGFDARGSYCVAAVSIEEKSEGMTFGGRIESEIEKIIYAYKKSAASFRSGGINYFVFCNFTEDEIGGAVSAICALSEKSYLRINKIYAAVGPVRGGISSLHGDFKKTSILLEHSVKIGESPLSYDNQGFKKLLFAVDDFSVLSEFYKEALEPLETYDLENGTDYMYFLRAYLENDGSVKKVAQGAYVHRNTINYRLGKISRILNSDIRTLSSRLRLTLAFLVRDIIK